MLRLEEYVGNFSLHFGVPAHKYSMLTLAVDRMVFFKAT